MKKTLTTTNKLQLIGGIFCLPALALVLFATIIPVIWNIVLSFFNWNGVDNMTFAGLTNFSTLFHDKACMKAIGYSLESEERLK